jgi:hypothetical protein
VHSRFAAEEADVRLGVGIRKMSKDLVKILDWGAIGKSHGVNVGQANWAALVAQVCNVNSHRGGLGMRLVIAARAIHRAGWGAWFLVGGNIPFPAPFPRVRSDEGCGASALLAELGEVYSVISDFIGGLSRPAAFSAKTELHGFSTG